MYSIEVALWLRREQGYLSAQDSTDRKAGRFSLPFYSIEFFDKDSMRKSGIHVTAPFRSNDIHIISLHILYYMYVLEFTYVAM